MELIRKWKEDIHEAKLNSESYCYDCSTKKKYFLRVFDHQVDIQKVVNTFYTWNQGLKPNVIISVTGGAKNFILPDKLRTSFKEGISMIAEKTHALIITGKLIFINVRSLKNNFL
jgi:hypothetical protein